MGTEVWILGGTGRSARAIATEVMNRGLSPVLVGRDATRLAEAAARVKAESQAESRGTAADAVRIVVAATLEAMAAEIRKQQPAVVINTIGPFSNTAGPIIEACLPDSHYVDLANDVAAVTGILDRNDVAHNAGRTLVTGAGFGVTATESVVVKLCAQKPGPIRVRVNMLPSLSLEAGRLGEALASGILDGAPGLEGGGRYQGRQYRNGRLAPAKLAGNVIQLTLPDGSTRSTAGMPLGELVAAQRASGAPDVLSASSEAPTATAVRALLPLVTALLGITRVREFAKRRLAQVQFKARDRPREYSWGHARLEWADGTTRDGWLRLGDAQTFTGAVPAEVALRLLNGEGKSGAWTPAALFGPSLAESCGGEYLLDTNNLTTP